MLMEYFCYGKNGLKLGSRSEKFHGLMNTCYLSADFVFGRISRRLGRNKSIRQWLDAQYLGEGIIKKNTILWVDNALGKKFHGWKIWFAYMMTAARRVIASWKKSAIRAVAWNENSGFIFTFHHNYLFSWGDSWKKKQVSYCCRETPTGKRANNIGKK